MSLTQSQRIGIIEARTLAKAYTRSDLIDALALCNSPAVVGLTAAELAELRMADLLAAGFGALAAMAEELCATVENLAAQADARGSHQGQMTTHRPLFHYSRDQLAALADSGDTEAIAEWNAREGITS